MAETYGFINVPDFVEDVDLSEIESDIADLKSGKADKTELADLAKKSDIPTDYLTEPDIEDFVTDTEVDSKITEATKDLASKSDVEKKADASELEKKADKSELEEVKASVSKVYRPMGSVATKTDLDSKTATASEGDVYNVLDTGMNYAFTAEGTWDELGSEYDLTPYVKTEDLEKELAKKADSSDLEDLEEKLESKADATDLSDYVTNDKLSTELAKKADTSEVEKKLDSETAESTYAKKTDIPDDYLTDEDIEDFVTGEEVDGKITTATQGLASEASVSAVSDEVDGLKEKIITITETTYSMDPSSFTGSDSAGYDGVATVTGLGATDKFKAYYNPEQYDAYRAAGITGIISQAAGQFGVHAKKKPSVTLTGTVEIRKEGVE